MLNPKVLIPLIASLLGASACDDSQSGSSRVQIALTDAPGDGIQTAFFVISEIYLQGQGGRTVLRDTPVTVDLVSLSNRSEVLVDLDVPDGRYSELRFVIDGAWLEVDTGNGTEFYATAGFEGHANGAIVHELKTPSWSSSGLKLKLPGDVLIVDGTQRFLMVDFDLAESVQTATGNEAWVMSPVVQVNDVAMTTSLELHVRLGAGLTLDMPIYVQLYDREGYSEGSILLVLANDGTYGATFVFIDPSEGPFTARIVTDDGLVISTLPALATIEGQSGLTISTDIELVAITVAN